MESFLPSEIARLVLGYLDGEGYTEAARVFLATSPYLQECRDVAARGRKFSTKVNGLTLTIMLEQYASLVGIVQERVNKLEDDLQFIKDSRDIVEQVRGLIDYHPSGQRCFGNINVSPRTTEAAGGSPIISSSMRKPRHSGTEIKDKSKGVNKENTEYTLNYEGPPKHAETDCTKWPIVKPPPLHANNDQRSALPQTEEPIPCHREESPVLPSSTVGESRDIAKQSSVQTRSLSTSPVTQKLMKYSNTEVQTVPLDIDEFQHEPADEPIENLSLWTMKILNNKEMQEKIAENINKVISSADLSMKDISFTEALGSGNDNVADMTTDWNIDFKGIVTATEKDPLFEELLHEIVVPEGESETSPDEEAQQIPTDTHKVSNNLPPLGTFKTPVQPTETPQVTDEAINPSIKQVPATSNINNDRNAALDDFNAAAIQSIIDVNIEASEGQKKSEKLKPTSSGEDIHSSAEEMVQKNLKPHVDNEKKIRQTTRKSRNINPKRKSNKPVIKAIETVSVPKLILCTKEEMMEMQFRKSKEHTVDQKFVPIAPKTSLGLKPQPMYLRTVNVPAIIPPPPVVQNPIPNLLNAMIINQSHDCNKNTEIINTKQTESITLYGGECNSGVSPQADIPIIDLDDSITLTGTGLSPFLKFNKTKAPPLDDCAKLNDTAKSMDTEEVTSATKKVIDCDLITKRTPKSLRKSREINHRLSLSTPRRRNSHIRALDFNTPSKCTNTSRRLSDAGTSYRNSLTPKASKSACRTSLFNSPPFGSAPMKERQGLKVIRRTSDPKSPTPKLSGGWDKVSGVGTILGSSSPAKTDQITVESAESNRARKSWDADLRQKLNIEIEAPKSAVKSKKKIQKTTAEVVIEGETVSPVVAKANSNNESGELNTTTSDCESNVSASVETKSISTLDKSVSMVVTKGITKKYVKLKTLTTSVTKTTINKNDDSSINLNAVVSDKSAGCVKSYLKNMPDMISLVTPQKTDSSLGIPPTPRVLSPSNSLTTPFVRANDDSSKIQSFIPTPEFPQTPRINLTPKQSCENTSDGKTQFAASYYQPSDELKESSKVTKTQIETRQIEITQFEVIKENLSQEEARKKLIISSNGKEIDLSGESTEISVEKTLDSSGTTTNESSDSVSDTSSSSGCSCSSSCSCSSGDDSDNTSRLSIDRKNKETPKKIATESSHEHKENSISKISQKTLNPINECVATDDKLTVTTKTSSESNRLLNEASPKKVFTIEKTPAELEDVDLETPAKNEALLSEADISETPCGSKNGIETLTNLTTKISALQDEPLNSEIPWRLHKLDESADINKEQNKKTLRGYTKSSTNVSPPTVENINTEVEKNISDDETIEESNDAADTVDTQHIASLRKSPRNALKVTKNHRRSLSQRSKKSSLTNKDRYDDRKGLHSEAAKMTSPSKEIITKSNLTTKNSTKTTEKTMEYKNEIHSTAKDKNEETKKSLETMDEADINAPSCSKSSHSKEEENLDIPETPTDGDLLETDEKEISVLESLELIPTVKQSVSEKKSDNPNTSFESTDSKYAYLFYVHDDNIPKKRRPKYKAPEIGYMISLASSDDDEKIIKLQASDYLEPFTLQTKMAIRPRRGKNDVKTVTKLDEKVEKNKVTTPSVNLQPLATSSPVVEVPTIEFEQTKSKPTKLETEKNQITTRKRKHCLDANKDEEPVTKKVISDPKVLLLRQVNINDFLTTVHGPAKKS